jgi:hypothetical protein
MERRGGGCLVPVLAAPHPILLHGACPERQRRMGRDGVRLGLWLLILCIGIGPPTFFIDLLRMAFALDNLTAGLHSLPARLWPLRLKHLDGFHSHFLQAETEPFQDTRAYTFAFT